MKTYSLIATIATAAASLLVFATPAAAQEATYDYPQTIAVSKTRAEVKAELAAAQAANRFQVAEAGYTFGDSHGTPHRAVATPVTADARPTAKAVPRGRAPLNTSNFEPQSFDGTVTAAGGAVGTRATRIN